MAKFRKSQFLFVLATLCSLSNASLSFPGASFFSSGLFGGSKPAEDPLADTIAAASNTASQIASAEYGTGTSNTQKPKAPQQSGGSGTSPAHGGSAQSSPPLSPPQYSGPQSAPPSYSPQSSPPLPSYGSQQQSPPVQNSYSQPPPPPPAYGGQQQQQHPPVYGGQQSPPAPTYGGQQPQPTYNNNNNGGSFQQKAPIQNNFYPPAPLPQSNSPGLPPYNPHIPPPVATYSSGVLPLHSGNTQPYLTAQSSNVKYTHSKPNNFITNAYDPPKLRDEVRAQENQYGGAGNDGFVTKSPNTTKKGAFSWTSPEGQMYEVSYVADALSSSRPQGNFVGSPQQIPEVSPPQRTMTQEAFLAPLGGSYDQISGLTNTNYPGMRLPPNNRPSYALPSPHSNKPYSRYPVF